MVQSGPVQRGAALVMREFPGPILLPRHYKRRVRGAVMSCDDFLRRIGGITLPVNYQTIIFGAIMLDFHK
jgi:uncharacterized protein YjeT (DUF2065 family)